MNRIPFEKRVKIVQLLLSGMSMRNIADFLSISFVAVLRLLETVGYVCQNFHDIHLQGLQSQRISMDEVHSFVKSRDKNTLDTNKHVAGTKWTWICMDNDSKVVITWLSGDRNINTAQQFTEDVAWRIKSPRLHISTDGLKMYIEAIHRSFKGTIDYAQIIKRYSNGKEESIDNESAEKKGMRYIGSEKINIFGTPNLKYSSTSLIERQNLTLRMQNRRFNRKTNAHSKKMENHNFALALHYFYYNFVRTHTTLGMTPAMHAGIMKRPLTIRTLIHLTEKSIYSK